MQVSYCKFDAFGNDYIVLERAKLPPGLALDELARRMCDRAGGVGSDGLAVLEKSDGTAGDLFCEIVNPDGSIAGFSGNGTRCAAAYLYYTGQWSASPLRLETRSGLKVYELTDRAGDTFRFRAFVGRPAFASPSIPMLLEPAADHVVDQPVDGTGYTFSALNVGNPVACIFVNSFDLDWRGIGARLETDRRFPERTNVVFVKVLDTGNVEVRIWERGAGETAASGTCASATAVMSAYLGKTGRSVSVHSPGGTTEVTWGADDEIVITGRADLVHCGEWEM